MQNLLAPHALILLWIAAAFVGTTIVHRYKLQETPWPCLPAICGGVAGTLITLKLVVQVTGPWHVICPIIGFCVALSFIGYVADTPKIRQGTATLTLHSESPIDE